MNEITTVQESVFSLKDKISERIREQFVELIPDDTWSQLVESEIKWFTSPVEKRGYYDKERISPLQDQVRGVLRDLAAAAIKKAFSDTEWLAKNGPDGQILAGQAVEKIAKEHAAEIVAQVFGSAVQGAVEKLRYQ